jgi:hypothetical protein
MGETHGIDASYFVGLQSSLDVISRQGNAPGKQEFPTCERFLPFCRFAAFISPS